MGYYQYIDGRKYDRSILDAVQALLDGKSKGALSARDAAKIKQYFIDAPDFSATSRRTIQRILETSRFAADARPWLKEQLDAKPVNWYESLERIVEEELGFHHLNINVKAEILSHQLKFKNTTNFEDAVRLALKNFTLYAGHEQSLRNVLQNLYGFEAGTNGTTDDGLLEGILSDHLNHAEFCLVPPAAQTPVLPDYHRYAPDEATIPSNWVFGLLLHELPNWYFWAVIDREHLQDPFNFGKIQPSPAWGSN